MSETFEHRKIVTIGETNMEGNVYWLNFCRWFGEVRELFLLSLLPPEVNVAEFLKLNEIAIVTCDIGMDFLKPAFFTDRIIVRINTSNFGRCRLDILVEIENETSGEVIARGKQKLAFVSTASRRFVPIPDALRQPALEYLSNGVSQPLVGAKL